MKNRKTVLWFALIVMVIIPACAQQYDTILNGTWKHENGYISKYNSGNFENTDNNGNPTAKGTYTTSNDKITFTITHIFGSERLAMDTRWYSKDEMREDFPSYLSRTKTFEPKTNKYVVNGNKLTFTDDNGKTTTLTLVSREDNSKKSVPVSSGGGKTLNSVKALGEYLDSQPANSPDKPIKVSMAANAPMLPKIAAVLNDAGKYVSLNLTGSALITIPKYAFYDEDEEEGCETLVSITIPNSVTSIGSGAFLRCKNLTSVMFQGTITANNLDYQLPGDLRDKYLAGGPGTYTRSNGRSNTWTKQ